MRILALLLICFFHLVTYSNEMVPTKLVSKFSSHQARINSFQFHPTKPIIISADKKGNIIVTNYITGKVISELSAHKRSINALSISNDGNFLVSGSDDKTVIYWDLKELKKLKTIDGFTSFITGVSFNKDASRVLVADLRGNVSIWNTANFDKESEFKAHGKGLTVLKLSKTSKYIATGSRDGEVKLWNAATQELISNITEHTGAVTDIDFNLDESKIAIVSKSNEVVIWDIENAILENKLITDANEKLTTIGFLSNGNQVFTGGNASSFKLLNIETQAKEYFLDTQMKGITKLIVNEKLKKVAVAGLNGEIAIFDILNTKKVSSNISKLTTYVNDLNSLKVEELLIQGLDVNSYLAHGRSMLSQVFYSLPNDHSNKDIAEFVVLLLKYGAKINTYSTQNNFNASTACRKTVEKLNRQDLLPICTRIDEEVETRGDFLLDAAESNHIDFFKKLLTRGADINYINLWDTTALMYAAENNLVDMCKLILSVKELVIGQTNESNMDALQTAKEYGNLEVASLIQEEILKRESATQDFYTAIYNNDLDKMKQAYNRHATTTASANSNKHALDIAIINNNLDAIRWLLEIGHLAVPRDVHLQPVTYANSLEAISILYEYGLNDIYNRDSETGHCSNILDQIVKNDNIAFFKEILNTYNVPTNREIGCEGKQNLLHIAFSNNSFRILKFLISKTDIDINTPNYEGLTPLQVAIQAGKNKFVKALILKGADVNKVITGTKTPLFLAIERGDSKLVYLLLSKNAGVDFTFKGKSILALAIESGNKKIIDNLLKYIDIDLISNDQVVELYTSAIIAADDFQIETLKNLGLDINTATEEDKKTALHGSIRHSQGTLDNLIFAIENGADIDLEDIEQRNALFISIDSNKLEIVSYLLPQYDSIEMVGTKYSMSPYLYAAWRGKVEIIKYLLAKGANSEAVDIDGWNDLAFALDGKKIELVKSLIKSGSNVDIVFTSGTTLIEHANTVEDNLAAKVITDYVKMRNDVELSINTGNINDLKEIIKTIPNFDFILKNGTTPLISAIMSKKLNIVKFIIKHTANIKMKDRNGASAIYYAVNSNNVKLVQAFDGHVFSKEEINGSVKFIDVSLGARHACAIDKNQNAWCWGENKLGQLGIGNTRASKSINLVLSGVKKLVSGYEHTCALLMNNKIKCWGSNTLGRLGIQSSNNNITSSPYLISTKGIVIDIVAGVKSTCYQTKEKLYCTGSNKGGGLGVGSNSEYVETFTEALITKNKKIKKIFSGAGFHKCAIDLSDKVYCWGYNSSNQTSTNFGTNDSQPVLQSDITDLKTIATGYKHTCYLKNDGTVHCKGTNAKGQLGISLDTAIKSQYTETSIKNAKQLVVGGEHSCVIKEDNNLYCWGRNESNHTLGSELSNDNLIHPQLVKGVQGFLKVSSNWYGSCAIDSDNFLYCWGNDLYAKNIGEKLISNSSLYQINASNTLLRLKKSKRWDILIALQELGIAIDMNDAPKDLIHILLENNMPDKADEYLKTSPAKDLLIKGGSQQELAYVYAFNIKNEKLALNILEKMETFIVDDGSDYRFDILNKISLQENPLKYLSILKNTSFYDNKGSFLTDFVDEHDAENLDVINFLLVQGFYPTRHDNTVTPLHIAIKNNNYELARIFAQYDKDLNLAPFDTLNYMNYAIQENNLEIIKILVEAGYDLNKNMKQDRELFTPLYQAIFEEKDEILDYFLTQSIDVKGENKYALNFAANENNDQINIVKLINFGFNLNLKLDGRTPLMNAARRGRKDQCQTLLWSGANKDIKDNNGKKAYQIAKKAGYKTLSKYIRKFKK